MHAKTRRIACPDNTRAKIQATKLINRLHAHAMGEVELSNTQVKAIEVLLRKTLPDLQATTLNTDDGSTLSEILKELSGQDTGLPEPVERENVH